MKGASKSLASNSPNFPLALRDNRIQLVRSTPHELSISISNVALADEGEYTCSIFTMPVRTAKSLVTVLGEAPKPQYHHSMLSCKRISLGGPLKVPRAKQVFKPFGKVQPLFPLQWNKMQRVLILSPLLTVCSGVNLLLSLSLNFLIYNRGRWYLFHLPPMIVWGKHEKCMQYMIISSKSSTPVAYSISCKHPIFHPIVQFPSLLS